MRLVALLVLAASLVVADPPSALPHAVARRGSSAARVTLASVDAPRDGAGAPRADPTLADIDTLVAAAIAESKLPGCVVTIGRRDRILFRKVYGLRTVEPEHVAMTEDTVFDLASLTKPVATATSIMI